MAGGETAGVLFVLRVNGESEGICEYLYNWPFISSLVYQNVH